MTGYLKRHFILQHEKWENVEQIVSYKTKFSRQNVSKNEGFEMKDFNIFREKS